LKDLLTRLEAWLAKHRRRFLAGLRPGASTAELATLDKHLGFAAPPDLRLLLAWHNGQGEDVIGKFEEDWQLMSSTGIAAAKGELDAAAAATGWQNSWVPFLDNDAGDYRCLDSTSPGIPVRDFWLGNKDQPTVAPSLRAWLTDFVHDVEKGVYEEEPERGTFIRKR
jgi:cell wall assembly regulator SMI1